MKAILEFNLPEDRADYDLAANAGKLALALHDISTELRSRAKYGTSPSAECFQDFREWMGDNISENVWELLA